MKQFVKWVGSKKQLLSEIDARLPKEFNRYFEPFVGGGSVFMHLEHSDIAINDFNRELINCYEQIRDNPILLIRELSLLDDIEYSKDIYYDKRDEFNQKIMLAEHDVKMAALFIYLNKHAWNGVYRVNNKGGFNVPWNQKLDKIKSFDEQNILEISDYLRYNDVNILCSDFESALGGAASGDFVFLDPPYIPVSKTANFTDYQKSGFSKENHERVAKVMKDLDSKGVYVMACNNNVPEVYKLYKDFNIESVDVRRSINRNGNDRKGKEVLITNY